MLVIEPGDFVGPDGPNRIDVELVGFADGPPKSGAQGRYAVFAPLSPFMLAGEEVQAMVATVQYGDDAIEEVVRTGGPVRMACVRSDLRVAVESTFQLEDVDFIMTGRVRPSVGHWQCKQRGRVSARSQSCNEVRLARAGAGCLYRAYQVCA